MEKTKCEKSRSTSSRALHKTHARVEVYGQRAPVHRVSIFNPPHWAGVHQAHILVTLFSWGRSRVQCMLTHPVPRRPFRSGPWC